MDTDHIDISNFLKHLSHQDFLDVGMDQVAYVRRVVKDNAVTDTDNADESYVIYAADGSQISVMDSYDTAVAAIHINDLCPVTLH